MKADPSFSEQHEIDPLNSRELEILGLIAEGLSNNQIALRLNLSQETVKWYNKSLFSKLGTSSRTEAVAKADEFGLLETQAQSQVKAEARPKHNLPAAITSFVGRENEIVEISRSLSSNRLLVLTGPGGSGKTRLALQVAQGFVGQFRDGVWLVELALLVHPARVGQALAEVLGLSSPPDETLEVVLKRYLARKHLLLILDNFEHLLDAAPFVGEILAAAPQVVILVTSRERLHIYGEQEVPVRPLGLPDLSRRETSQQILGCDAVKLFLQRAQALRPELSALSRPGEVSRHSYNDAQIAAAAQICIQLDGLPLALELAASQAKIYSLTQLAQHLKGNLANLPAGPRDLPARQQTLRATIEWSYSLLTAEEKVLFARLAIFKGSGTLEAIESICQDPKLDSVQEKLTSLVDKNMVNPREGQDGELHFTQLETIHEYALECLEKSGEIEWLRQQHAAYYVALAELANRESRGARSFYWFSRLRIEQENLQSILQWSSGRQEGDDDLRLVAALGFFWYYDAKSIKEALRWVDLALEKSKNAAMQLSAGVMISAGRILTDYRDLQTGRKILRAAYEIYQNTGDEHQAAWSLLYLSCSYYSSPAEAEQGIYLCQDALAFFRKVNDPYGISHALNILGDLSRQNGDYDLARHYYEECLQVATEAGDRLRAAVQYGNIGIAAYHQKQQQTADRMVRIGLRLYLEANIDVAVAMTMVGLAGSAILTGKPERAARVLGASQTLLGEMGARNQPSELIEIDHFIEEIKRMTGEAAFQAAWAQGAAMTYQEAVAYALEETEQHP